jgi:hypothetical protein
MKLLVSVLHALSELVQVVRDTLRISLIGIISDFNQVLNISKQLLSLEQEVVFHNELQVFSLSLWVSLFIDSAKGFSHDCNKHVQKNN